MFRYYEYDILWGIAGRSTAESNRIKCKLSFYIFVLTFQKLTTYQPTTVEVLDSKQFYSKEL